MDKYSIIEELKAIKPILCEKYGVTELALFGSYSRNEQSPESDIDIMVDFTKKPGIEFIYMTYDLYEIFPGI